MAGSNGTFTETLKNTVTEKVSNTVSNLGGDSKANDKTIFGVKLNADDFEKVSRIVNDAAEAIGPFLAKSREKTAEVAQNAPGVDRFEEQFKEAIEAFDKRQTEARDRARAGASSARVAAASAAASAREATTKAAESAKEATANVAASAREATSSARDATTHARDTAKEATANMAASARGARLSAREATANARESAKAATSQAASETADASKNFLALLFWLGAAIAAIYFLILNQERREQVAGYVRSGSNVAWEIISDVRGEDGQFTK